MIWQTVSSGYQAYHYYLSIYLMTLGKMSSPLSIYLCIDIGENVTYMALGNDCVTN